MARYIDADKLVEMYERSAEDDWNKKTAPSSWAEAFECAIADIDDQPTADVVPKSEMEKLQEVIFKKEDLMQKIAEERNKYSDELEALKDTNEHLAVMLEEAKTEVAREISRDIIEPLWEAYKNSESKETVLLVALICESINAQLKKKYTEGEK